jgi:hypothetical protein
MSYIRTKLSDEDKDILDYIYEELEDITLPLSYRKGGQKDTQGHRVRTGACSQKQARQTCFGYTYFQGKLQLSSYSKKYPEMMELFDEFIDSHYPDLQFDSVYVNKNVKCKKHLDSKNAGVSLLVGLGDYTGGETILYINNKARKFNIQKNSIIFNGSEIEHKSLPFKGTRYSLVFFNS